MASALQNEQPYIFLWHGEHILPTSFTSSTKKPAKHVLQAVVVSHVSQFDNKQRPHVDVSVRTYPVEHSAHLAALSETLVNPVIQSAQLLMHTVQPLPALI